MSKIPFGMHLDTVLKEYDANLKGLTETQAKKRLQELGYNELTEKKKKSKLAMFFGQFKDLMLIILIFSAFITATISIVQKEYLDLIDSGIILLIVIINAIIGYVQERKADNALQSLKEINSPKAKVFRNGVLLEIPTREVVVGDIVLLEAGDVICADCYLAEAHSLRCDESSLTGESHEVEKQANIILGLGTPLGDRVNMVHSGSVVTYGRGIGVVVATGMQTEMGKIASLIDKQPDNELTPIQVKLKKLSKAVTIGVLAIAMVVFIINIAVGGSDVVNALMVAIAIAVAAIPESLPAVITVIMAMGVSRMSKQRAIIRKLHAVETLGSCQVICTDKTGTLTQNKMTVSTFFANNKIYDKDNLANLKDKHFFNCMILCNDTVLQKNKTVGDPTETAMIDVALKLGLDVSKIRENCPRVNEIPFDSKRKMMTSINQINQEYFAYTKGAPDVVLERCSYTQINGEVMHLSKAEKDEILQNIDKLSCKGLRSLALCYKTKRNAEMDEFDENKMIFLGLVAMRDPPRETTVQAVKTCISAGIKPIMITGDHALTARAIAEEVGIYKQGDIVLTGAELDAMSDEDYKKILKSVTVYARVSPQNKVQIVEAWKSTGAVVAMTGDGVNDSPSIKAADIGIGMGKTGTEVTKQVADMVLTDDNFATIVGAVQEGRKTYANIKKVIQFLFGTNLVEVLSILLATLIYPTLGFLTALQILFINLITDSLPALSLSVEKAEKDVMKHPPRPKNEGLFANVWDSMLVQILFQTACVIGTFAICMHLTGNNTLAVTMAFAVLSISQIFHLVNVRHEHSLFVSQVFTNKTFWFTFLLGIGINILIISIPAVASVFGMMPLSIIQWLIVFGVSISIIPVIEIYKFIKYLISKNATKNAKVTNN